MGNTGKTRAKIVCTLGPASSDYEVIERMVCAGMNVARLNFSHGDREQHRRVIENLRRASRETGLAVGILADLQGPKVRVGRFEQDQTELVAGQRFTITARDVAGTDRIVSTTYAGLPGDVSAGGRILLDDGLLVLAVEAVEGEDIHCRVEVGGVLKNNKGINIPGTALSVETFTDKDMDDAAFAVEQGVDFIAMSFVRHPDDVRRLRAFLEARDAAHIPICAKIEKPQALEHMAEIVHTANMIMVARGDLGVEMAPEEVPAIQKRLIAECNRQGRPVITATQMLESMVNNPRPTRAEASDVANAILDGTDAVMLSAESASGKYPVEAIAVMRRIILATEDSERAVEQVGIRRRHQPGMKVHEGVAVTATNLAELVGASAIACITLTGNMAILISRDRPRASIYAISQFERVVRRLSVVWGIEGILLSDLTRDIDAALEEVEDALLARGLLAKGDALVLTAGLPFAARQATNMVRVDTVN